MRNINEVFKERRIRAGVSMDELAKVAKCSKGTIAQIESGDPVANRKFSTVMQLCKILSIDALSVINVDSFKPLILPRPTNRRTIRVLTLSNTGRITEQLNSENIEVDLNDGDDMPVIPIQGDLADSLSQKGFAFKIEGNDNSPAYVRADQIIVDPEVKPEPGQMCVVMIEDRDDAILRKFKPREGGEVLFEPINSDYPTTTLKPSDKWQIVGTVVNHSRDPRNS